ncbi:MAG: potassium transporter [Chloroflexaceae bacterium]|nr:potassium transporter [Chloroflexaceae bacterium]
MKSTGLGAAVRRVLRIRSGTGARPNWQTKRSIPPALRIVIGLVILVATGTALLMLPWVGVNRPLTWNEALFTATSALSVTGLSIIVPSTDLTLFGQIVLLVLIQIGGVGFLVGTALLFQFLGRKFSMLNRMALTDSLGLPVPGAILQVTRRVLIGVLLIEGAGALLLWWHWHDMLGEQAIFYAIFHAISAFCNAGFDLFGGLPEFPTGIPKDNLTLIILGMMIFLGGLGIPVVTDLIAYPTQRRISLHTRITLVTVAILIVVGGLGLFLAEYRPGGVLEQEPMGRAALMSFFQSISTRTAGFAGMPSFELLGPASQLLLMVLMFIGCAPASMGGGITTGTLATLVLALWAYARGLPTAQIAGRSIAQGMVRKAAAVLTVSLFAVGLSTWLILMTHDTTLDAALFEVISAFATCGLTLAFTSQLNLFGQLVIIVMMFWGRLGALTLFVAFGQPRTTQQVNYPEEQILIG